MNTKKINIKIVIILVSVILGVILICSKIQSENAIYSGISTELCMGVPIITEEQLEQIAHNFKELESMVCLYENLAPYDQECRTIYIPYNITEETIFSEMTGVLCSDWPDYKLFFLKEDAFDNMQKAVSDGHTFKLVALDSIGDYTAYQVIFTTLPVVEMSGKCIDIDERDRDINFGVINAWEPLTENAEQAKVQTARLEWKIRGNSAMYFPKKSLKLSIKNKNYQKKNASLLGMESDDDYILNPMWLDDLKVREMMTITLWNEIAEEKNSNLRMSDSKYCEVIINGSYQGLFMLQKRIEKKSLKLNENTMLFKGNNIDPTEDNTSEDVFEIIYTPTDTQMSYRAMDDFLKKSDFSNVDKNNWVDTQLFTYLGNMIDNRRYKNMYYILEDGKEQKSLRFLPWDTDMSFGISWTDKFEYNLESVEEIYHRVEYDAIVAQYPELEKILSERWWELRENIFSLENILGIVNSNYEILDSSGVLARDYQVFNQNAWGGKDTRENLETYIIRRLEILDEKYGYTQ